MSQSTELSDASTRKRLLQHALEMKLQRAVSRDERPPTPPSDSENSVEDLPKENYIITVEAVSPGLQKRHSMSPDRNAPPVLDLSALTPQRHMSLETGLKLSTRNLLHSVLDKAKSKVNSRKNSRKNSRRNSRQNTSRSPEKAPTSLVSRAAEAKKKLGNQSNRSHLGDTGLKSKKRLGDASSRSKSKESRVPSILRAEEPPQMIDLLRRKAIVQKRSQAELIKVQVEEFMKRIRTSSIEEAEEIVTHAEELGAMIKGQRNDSFCRALGQQLMYQLHKFGVQDTRLSTSLKSRLEQLVQSIKGTVELLETKEELQLETAEHALKEAVNKLTIKRVTVSCM